MNTPMYDGYDVTHEGIVGQTQDSFWDWHADNMRDTPKLLKHMSDTAAFLRDKLERVEAQEKLVRIHGRIRVRGAFRAYEEYKRSLNDFNAHEACDGRVDSACLRELHFIGRDLLARDLAEATEAYTYIRQRICATWFGCTFPYLLGSQ